MSYTLMIGRDDDLYCRSQWGHSLLMSVAWMRKCKFPMYSITGEEMKIVDAKGYVRTLGVTGDPRYESVTLSENAYVACINGHLMEVLRVEEKRLLVGARGDMNVNKAPKRRVEKGAFAITTGDPFLIVNGLLVVFDLEGALPLIRKLPFLSIQRWGEKQSA